jgi:hypothetical protein
MLVPLGARAAMSMMRSISSRGTGWSSKPRTARRSAIARSIAAHSLSSNRAKGPVGSFCCTSMLM